MGRKVSPFPLPRTPESEVTPAFKGITSSSMSEYSVRFKRIASKMEEISAEVRSKQLEREREMIQIVVG